MSQKILVVEDDPTTADFIVKSLTGEGFVVDHAADGREEFHILPAALHGHLHCNGCGTTWDIEADEASTLVKTLERRRSFAVDVSHLSIAGRCADCTETLED